MTDIGTRIIETLVDLYEHQTGEKFKYRELSEEEIEEQKDKTA